MFALNVLHTDNGNLDIEKIYSAYISKHKSKVCTANFFLMIPNEEGWHYISATKLSALLREVTSTHDDDFYCLNSLHLFITKNKLESH